MGFTRWQWYYNKIKHKNTHITQDITPRSNKTVHKARQTIKDTLHTINTKQKKIKAILATGRGGLWGCEISRIQHCPDNRLTDGG
jgi:hypothetical protein